MTIVQIGTATVRIGPVGFALYAEEFLLAATSIPQQSRARGNTTFSPVPYYLLCRALELVLKAYLIERAVPLDKLKKRYGHNLEKLWRATLQRDLGAIVGPLSADFAEDLRKANAYYRTKVFEYFDFHRWAENYDDLPDFERFKTEAQQVITKTRSYCISAA